ncbi:hypothetical protein ACWT_4231 [Actinoplanes sp. SE50]|uniref:hypothetical protein n=1 Tax=unclassified Actinoplanes TaxID=2626549 RepID=UPI00023EC48F|nr:MULTISPECIES: hypothetical protein [unclassified Actinoplanes]AEV85251.1 hypothetical protein ACPL_4360 [Actinoplanes sp. SE50/110]ATO83646.1 hypothetical protein ACWT_4231 [Actinoplanes sp. SE50]SLM01054.1 hypothetical protein ACSP50_4287 [Actinoplanes sp. SE50/110]
MSVPSFAEVNRIRSAATMRDLIRRDDLPDDPQWWLAVISVGQAALLGAESGQPGARAWAPVLVESLDAAERRPALGVAETVHRRLAACLAAIHYFGTRTGDPVRDPKLVLDHLEAALGGTPEAYLARYRETLATALAEHRRIGAGRGGDRRAVSSARAWLTGTRAALVQMCRELAPLLSGTDAAPDVTVGWQAAVTAIEQIRREAQRD